MVYNRVKIQADRGDGEEEVDEDDGGGTDNHRCDLTIAAANFRVRVVLQQISESESLPLSVMPSIAQ